MNISPSDSSLSKQPSLSQCSAESMSVQVTFKLTMTVLPFLAFSFLCFLSEGALKKQVSMPLCGLL